MPETRWSAIASPTGTPAAHTVRPAEQTQRQHEVHHRPRRQQPGTTLTTSGRGDHRSTRSGPISTVRTLNRTASADPAHGHRPPNPSTPDGTDAGPNSPDDPGAGMTDSVNNEAPGQDRLRSWWIAVLPGPGGCARHGGVHAAAASGSGAGGRGVQLAAGACLSDVEAWTRQERVFGLGGDASDTTVLRVIGHVFEDRHPFGRDSDKPCSNYRGPRSR